MKIDDAIKLFMQREGATLLGNRKSNLWLLIGIFAVAILSIGIGSASMAYLNYKMNDPFVQYLDFNADQTDRSADKVTAFLNDEQMQSRYGFVKPQRYINEEVDIVNSTGKRYLQKSGRDISADGNLIAAILKDENVLFRRDSSGKAQQWSDYSPALIVTAGTLSELGYDVSNPPRFVYLSIAQDTALCNNAGVTLDAYERTAVCFPVAYVVRQLPGMNAVMFSKQFGMDFRNGTWQVADEKNNEALVLCSEDIGELEKIKEALYSIMDREDVITEERDYDESFSLCRKLSIRILGRLENPAKAYHELYQNLKVDESKVHRLYDFISSDEYAEKVLFYSYSVEMKSLDSIRSFAEVLKRDCDTEVRMENIHAKENFRHVQRMGNSLSVCIILIAVIFIGVFIYYILTSHFQKIQRNVGTFKAFGVSQRTLTVVYTTMLTVITIVSYVIAMATGWIVQIIIGFFVQIEQGFAYIDIWTWQNIPALLVASIIVTISVTMVVIKDKCRHSPGDLIYDRIVNI